MLSYFITSIIHLLYKDLLMIMIDYNISKCDYTPMNKCHYLYKYMQVIFVIFSKVFTELLFGQFSTRAPLYLLIRVSCITDHFCTSL